FDGLPVPESAGVIDRVCFLGDVDGEVPELFSQLTGPFIIRRRYLCGSNRGEHEQDAQYNRHPRAKFLSHCLLLNRHKSTHCTARRPKRIRWTVGAVSHRASFLDSRKNAGWDTAPTIERMRFARPEKSQAPARP